MVTNMMSPTSDTNEKTQELILDSNAQIEVAKLHTTSLEDLEEKVQELQGCILSAKSKVDDALSEKLAHVCRQGIFLIAAKAKVGHTNFIPWLKRWKNKDKTAPSLRTAERRMVLGANSTRVSQMPPGTSINQAFIKLGIKKQPAAVGPAEQISRHIKIIKAMLKSLSNKVPLSERTRLAGEIRAAERGLAKAACKMETSVLIERMREEAVLEWVCDCILLGY